jgi:hypothetical protein
MKSNFLKQKKKNPGDMVQMIECLPCKCEALNSNPSTKKINSQNKQVFMVYLVQAIQ